MSDEIRYASKLIFDFDTIVDIDIAFIRFFKLKFGKSKFIDSDIIKNNDLQFYKTLLFQRKHKNPLSIIIKPAYIDQIDELYKSVYEKYTNQILALVEPLALTKYFKVVSETEFLQCFVICKNEQEEQYCNQHFSNVNIVKRDELIDFKEYDCIYIKNIEDLNKMQHIAKDVYLYKYQFNMEDDSIDIPKISIFGDMLLSLKLHLVDPYNDYKKPI